MFNHASNITISTDQRYSDYILFVVTVNCKVILLIKSWKKGQYNEDKKKRLSLPKNGSLPPQKGVQSDTIIQYLQCSSTGWQFRLQSGQTLRRYNNQPAGDKTVDRASTHDRLVNPLEQEKRTALFLSGKVIRSQVRSQSECPEVAVVTSHLWLSPCPPICWSSGSWCGSGICSSSPPTGASRSTPSPRLYCWWCS